MKKGQKFILPALIVLAIGLIYLVYFKSDGGLGSFSDFDTNNSAVKDVRVKILQDRGINRTMQGGASFFTSDKGGMVVLIHADKIPTGLDNAEVVTLRGHLNKDSFHAHDVLLD